MNSSFSLQTAHKTTDVTFSDVLNSTQDKVHAQLYERALDRYIEHNNINKDSYRFIEIPASYYDVSSYVQVISRKYPYKRYTTSLEQYWENPDFETTCSYLLIDNELTLETAEIKYKDYVRGSAELYSRMTGRTLNVPLESVPSDMKDYTGDRPANDSFIYLVNTQEGRA